MESKWRLNVALTGLVGGSVRKMARVLTIPGEWYLAQSTVLPYVSTLLRVLLPGDLPVAVGPPVIHPVGSSFPWGASVEPD